MDNIAVTATSIFGLYLCEVLPQSAFPEVTPLAIVALCVYYFLTKFDKKMDAVVDKTDKIEDLIKDQRRREEEQHNAK